MIKRLIAAGAILIIAGLLVIVSGNIMPGIDEDEYQTMTSVKYE